MNKIITLIFALIFALTIKAGTTVSLSAAEKSYQDVSLTPGTTNVVYVYFTGASTFCGFQAQLFLPEGVTITKKANCYLTKDEDGENVHTCQYSDKTASGEGWQLLIYSSEMTKFTADEGGAMKLTLSVDANFKGGKGQFKNIIFTDPKTTLPDGAEFTISSTFGQNYASSINLNTTNLNMKCGETAILAATVLPENATDKSVTWTSNNNTVATVTSDGVVKAISIGSAVITATTNDGTNLSASCNVTVTDESGGSNQETTVTLSGAERSLQPVILTPGNTSVVYVYFTGASTFCGFQAQLFLPEGVSITKKANCYLTKDEDGESVHNCQYSDKTASGEGWQLLVYSSELTKFTADEGGAMKLTLSADASFSGGTARFKNIIFTDPKTILPDGEDIPIITEFVYASSINLNTNNLELECGETATLSATVLPENATNKSVTWTSSNSSIATVTTDGVVKAVSRGTATIKATTNDGTNLTATASCKVTFPNPVTSVTLNKTNVTLIVGQKVTLVATCTPSDADDTTITWSSKDSSIATVDGGVVTAKAIGTTTITARSVNGIEATCSINVVRTAVTSITLNTTSIRLEKNYVYFLKATVLPTYATNKNVIWSSDDNTIADVGEDGRVTANASGKTRIVATSESDPTVSAYCLVEVYTPLSSITILNPDINMYVDDNVKINVSFTPSDADNKELNWEVNNTNIATVTSDGWIIPKKTGTVKITATTTDGTNLSASCNVTITKHEQSISWNPTTTILREDGEMLLLDATTTSNLPITYKSDNDNILTIMNVGGKAYANPVGSGSTWIAAIQSGNDIFESTEARIQIVVEETTASSFKTLVVYYSQSSVIKGIVTELAKQLAELSSAAAVLNIEPTNERINEGNTNAIVRDSIMNLITNHPDDINCYPDITYENVNLVLYDAIIMVYPLWNGLMAAPMQTFYFKNKDILATKNLGFIEYEFTSNVESSSDSSILRLSYDDIDNQEQLIRDWLNNNDPTRIRSINSQERTPIGIYDLTGRKLDKIPQKGIYIINGRKIAKVK